MTVEQMRCRLADAYPGPKWRLRCMQMPDRQVVAIFKNMNQTGRYKKHIRKRREPNIKKAVQLTIFDLPEMQEAAT